MASSIELHLDTCLAKQEKPALPPPSSSSSSTSCSSAVFDAFEHELCPGLWLIPNFVSEDEEADIVARLEADAETPWHLSSFNGHCLSKCFGLRTQFGAGKEERIVRVNDVKKGEHDMPPFLAPYVARLHAAVRAIAQRKPLPSILQQFHPNECNVNCYVKADGHFLTPHFDDRYLSGPVLMNLSLCGASVMTYSKGESTSLHDVVSVELPRRTLQLVTGKARFNYKHAIRREDVLGDKRVSITWRQACPQSGLVRGMAAGKNGTTTIDALFSKAPTTTTDATTYAADVADL